MTRRSRALGALLTAAAIGVCSACGDDAATVGSAPQPTVVRSDATVLGPTEGSLSAAAATRFFRSTPTALVADAASPADIRAASDAADARGLPMLTVSPATLLAVERALARLGVGAVYTSGRVDLPHLRATGVALAPLRDVPAASPDGSAPAETSTAASPSPAGSGVLVLATTDTDPGAVATARAAGATVLSLPAPDPRSSGQTTRALRGGDTTVVALGTAFGTGDVLADRLRDAQQPAQLFGGGRVVFPGRRFVALYGAPGTPGLGVLGHQDLPAALARVKTLAAQYGRPGAEPVVPAFEIIATVASAAPGPDGRYSSMTPVQQLEPWVRAAQQAGVYVTLDLQPGRTDFLTQAKAYERLLALPNVGLALDPEWRLRPNEVHLTQIGSVDPAEVNRVQDWLAGVVRDRGLPQKVLVLHQFTPFMLGDRAAIRTDHPELALVVHTDGHGTPGIKMGTWDRIRAGLPARMFLGWKNFYTEDTPMFSPAQTLALRPQPVFVSYQ